MASLENCFFGHNLLFCSQKSDIMAEKRRKFENDPDVFCYICGKYTFQHRHVKIAKFVERAYYTYFGVKLGDQNKPCAPCVACKSCVEHLREWSNGKRKTGSVPGIPMVWREPTDHQNDCYFCMVHVTGINSRTLSNVEYPSIPSATRPVSNSNDLPVPIFQGFEDPNNEVSSVIYRKMKVYIVK